MPFTPSHAVIALPFVRTPLVPAAIAIGAMAPDLPLFVRRGVATYSTTHDLTKIALTTVIALALFALWRFVLRPAAPRLLPPVIGDRLPAGWQQSSAQTFRESFGTITRVVLVLVSLVIGIVSHVVWDLFTHESRLGWAWLDHRWGSRAVSGWLQHASSIVGLAIIAVWAWRWWRKQSSVRVADRVPRLVTVAWLVSLPVALIVAVVWGYAQFGPLSHTFTIEHLAYRVLPPACAVWGLATVVLCAGIVIARSHRSR